MAGPVALPEARRNSSWSTCCPDNDREVDLNPLPALPIQRLAQQAARLLVNGKAHR